MGEGRCHKWPHQDRETNQIEVGAQHLLRSADGLRKAWFPAVNLSNANPKEGFSNCRSKESQCGGVV